MGEQDHVLVNQNLYCTDETIERLDHFIEEKFQEEGMRPKEYRLREVVVTICRCFNISEPSEVAQIVLSFRSKGTFPRLIRVQAKEIPKLVRSIMQQEGFIMTEKASPPPASPPTLVVVPSRGLTEAEEAEDIAFVQSLMQGPSHTFAVVDPGELVARESAIASDYDGPAPLSTSEVREQPRCAQTTQPHQCVLIANHPGQHVWSGQEPTRVSDEVLQLRKRLTELERLEEAHKALKSLVRLGYMTEIEACQRLFGGLS